MEAVNNKKVVIEADVTFIEKHWNTNAAAMIPEYWLVECVNIEDLFTGWEAESYRIYGMGNTREEAVKGFKSQCQEFFGKNGGVIKFI